MQYWFPTNKNFLSCTHTHTRHLNYLNLNKCLHILLFSAVVNCDDGDRVSVPLILANSSSDSYVTYHIRNYTHTESLSELELTIFDCRQSIAWICKNPMLWLSLVVVIDAVHICPSLLGIQSAQFASEACNGLSVSLLPSSMNPVRRIYRRFFISISFLR